MLHEKTLLYTWQLEGIYKNAHSAIRANPEPLKKKDAGKVTKKRWNLKKLSGTVRKHHVQQKKNVFLKNLSNEAEVAA